MNPRPLGYEPNELPNCSTPVRTETHGELFRVYVGLCPGIVTLGATSVSFESALRETPASGRQSR